MSTPDPVDRFSTEVKVQPDRMGDVGAGSASFVLFPADGQISWHFDSAGPLATSTGGGDAGMPMGDAGTVRTGGCRNVSGFTANAQPAFMANCVGCHGGGNASAMSAVDMSMMSDTSPTAQQTACNNILGRFDLSGDRSASLILQMSDYMNTSNGHGFHFPDAASTDAFQVAVYSWVASE